LFNRLLFTKHKPLTLLLVLILLLCVFATACGRENTAGETGAGVHDNDSEVKIVTSFYPVYLTAINITKDIPGVTVTNMTEPQTGCLHDYTLSTRDLKVLENADIFIINGGNMESFLEKVTRQMPDLKIVDSSEGMDFIVDEETGKPNPHVWVSISGLIEQTRIMSDKLSAYDSSNAEKYRQNAEEYIKKLEALKDKMHRELDGLKNRSIVTFHEAFPYFAKEFNLEIKAVLVHEHDEGMDAGKLAKTVDIIKKEGIKALFVEPQYKEDIAETVARETGAEIFTLDPIVTGEADGDTDAYIRRMEANLEVLKEALGD